MRNVRDSLVLAQHLACEAVSDYYAQLDTTSYPNKTWYLIEVMTDEAYALSAVLDILDMRDEVKALIDKMSDKC